MKNVESILRTYLRKRNQYVNRKAWEKVAGNKREKLSNLSKNADIKKLALARFREHLPHFKFKFDFTSFCESWCQDLIIFTTFLLWMSQIVLKMNLINSFKLLKRNITQFADNIQCRECDKK